MDCVIYNTSSVEKVTQLRKDGKVTMIKSAELIGDTNLVDSLKKDMVSLVHKSCQVKFCKKAKSFQMPSINLEKKTLRSKYSFEWKKNCFLCGLSITKSGKMWEVSTLEIKNKIEEICNMRNDNWTSEILGRINSCADLLAVEARYHVKCYLYLCRGSVQPGIELNNTNQRNLNVEGRKCFHNVCHKIEKHSGLYSLEDFQNKMSLLIDKEYVYSTKQIHHLLQEKYGSEMFITYVSGRENVIYFHNVASKIINDQWYNEHEQDETSERILNLAAKIVHKSINDMKYNIENYPTAEFEKLR